jgi:hypothetical protein
MNAMTDKPHSCVEEMQKLALRDFSLNLAITELKIYKERQKWRDECKMTAYFQSTPEKAAFSRLMYVAARVNHLYTISEISRELSISRQTLSKVTDDCCAAGWIVWEKVHGNSFKYKASEELCQSIEAYADYSSDMFLEGSVHASEAFLGMLKRRKPDWHRKISLKELKLTGRR